MHLASRSFKGARKTERARLRIAGRGVNEQPAHSQRRAFPFAIPRPDLYMPDERSGYTFLASSRQLYSRTRTLLPPASPNTTAKLYLRLLCSSA